MITKLNHVCIYVLNQESAYDFYVNKLGFKVHTDAPMGPGMRWLTLCAPEQPDVEFTIIQVEDGMIFKNGADVKMRELIQAGTFGFAVLECDNLVETYNDLSAKGVEFLKMPTHEFYGYEAIFKDDSGNWFSLGEKKK
ncbi:MAG: VOC family protein [Chitinophagia bacterium]|nr:VOC family protein [Chitinophagia bacterium]